MSEKFEKLLDLLVNEEKAKAEDLFHEIVVDKSREIYEELVSNDAEKESIKEKKESDEAPVEETKTSFILQLYKFEATFAYFLIAFKPTIPVNAFALPELTINTLHKFFSTFLSQIIGAEGVDDLV